MEQILSATQITKAYPGVIALNKVDFECSRGEVHALVGENGAGKSTFMKILAGAFAPDTGEVLFNGSRISIFTPQYAQELGIGIIYQELSLLPYLNVAENIFLGREHKNRFGLVDDSKMERRAREILSQLDERINPRELVCRLNPAQRQLVEVAKSLSFQPQLLIMDEPSSSLAEHELDQLFAVIKLLKNQGVSIIYISHRLEEIFQIADRVTILKDGINVGTYSIKEIDRKTLIRLMVGREVEYRAALNEEISDDVVLEVRKLNRSGKLHDINLVLHRGEILGVAGLMGAGRTELAKSIFGAEPVDSGEIILNQALIASSSPRRAISEGIVLVPEERKSEGLILIHTLRENVALPSLATRQSMGFVDTKAESRIVAKSLEELSIQAASTEMQVAYLSGGNQQKVVLAKWLNCGPQVIICDEPTRGIDVGAKIEIYELLRSLARENKSILMISSELPEILQLSDRIVVLSQGRVAGELNRHEATEEKVLELAYRDVGHETLDTDVVESYSLSGWPFLLKVVKKLETRLRNLDWSNSTVYILLALLVLTGLVGSTNFLTVPNLTNLLRQSVIPFFLGIGQTLVIISGGIDLSVGSIVTVTNVISAGLMAGQDTRVLPVAMVCLGIGIFIGMVNAFSVIKLHVPPIIATLGTMVIGQGLALLYTREPIGFIPRLLSYFANGDIGQLPVSTIFLVFVLVFAIILLYRAPYGRQVYAVGGDEETARLSGIYVSRVRAFAYIISGFLAAATGLYLASRMGSGDPTVGTSLAFDAIVAVLLGGTILGGGRGGLVGTIAGVLVLVVLGNVFNQLGINTWYQQIAKGLIIITAVLIYPQNKEKP